MGKKSPEKQAQLEKYLAITLAAIDYASLREIGSFVRDGVDPLVEIYESIREKVRNNFNRRRLDELQRIFDRWSGPRGGEEDLKWAEFIREKTGYEVEVPEPFEFPVNHSQQDRIYLNTPVEGEALSAPAAFPNNPKNERVFRKSRVEGEFLIADVSIVTGASRSDTYDWIESPDRSKTLSISTHPHRTSAYTSIHLNFRKGGSGPVFQANGVCPDISASWQDDHTIVIQTKKEFETPVRVSKVESRGEVVIINFLEA